MKRLGASLVVLLATVMAMFSICTACWWVTYQAELPQKPKGKS